MTRSTLETLAADPGRLREAVEAADPATLMLVLVQLTRDARWLDEAAPYIKGPMNYQAKIPAALAARIRAALCDTLLDFADRGRPMPGVPTGELLQKMLSVAAGEAVDREYSRLMFEELMAEEGQEDGQEERNHRGLEWRREPSRQALEDFHVVVIGAGMSGLCAGIRLREAGIGFIIIEKNQAVGGTWLENTYPGCGVDTPNHFYCYSFRPKHDWSHFFAKRPEIWQYFEDTADAYRLREHIRFSTEVTRLEFDQEAWQWRVSLRDDQGAQTTLTANAVITAVGILNRPKLPDIPGRDDFAGPALHTARWDPGFDWRGKRVAMIGTGASGQQVAPYLAPDAARFMVFQRSPHWVVPNPNYFAEVSTDKQWVLAHVPYYARWYRFQLFWAFGDGIHPALNVDPDWPEQHRSINRVNERHRQFMERHIRREIGDDPELLDKVWPGYPPYGKRILIDNHWYPLLKRPNVDLITEAIERIEPDGIRTRDGRLWPADAIVFATGFHAAHMLAPMTILGREGVDLRQLWEGDDPRAYLGTAVPGFPNFFILEGPNTGLAHGGNQIFMTECQVRYVMLALRELIENGKQIMEVRGSVYRRYNERVDALHDNMVWTHPGMTNWYRNKRGRVFAISPWRLLEFWQMTGELDPENYYFDAQVEQKP